MPRKQTKKDTARAAPSDLTETEQDLVSHVQNGYQLETNSLGRGPLLRQMEDKQAKTFRNADAICNC